jgi:hypothetical protein
MNCADRKLWAAARTLADLGELTAQWLEGYIASVPGYCSAPADETASLVPVLAAANRAGFVTDSSQPGESGDGWEQRAAVQGYADDETLDALTRAARKAPDGLVLLACESTRFRVNYRSALPVTRSGGRDFTWFGAALPRRHLRDSWTGYGECGREAVKAVCGAWQVTLIDTEWGREDSPLWAVLADFASRTPSGAVVHDRTPAPDGHPVRSAIGAAAEVAVSAALALVFAGALVAGLGTSWPVRLCAVWIAFSVTVYPVIDDVNAGTLRAAKWLDGHLRHERGAA